MRLDMSVERLAGYEEGLGRAWDDGLVRTCRPNAFEPARLATRELLGMEKPPTAILARRRGRVAAEWLLQAIARGGRARGRRRREILPTELVVRGTSARPKARR
jgi:DNA-binding LacI/PurR family transcriptional regulator